MGKISWKHGSSCHDVSSFAKEVMQSIYENYLPPVEKILELRPLVEARAQHVILGQLGTLAAGLPGPSPA